jgi:hypothetical protein
MAERDDKPPPDASQREPAGFPHQTPRTRAEKAARQARLAQEMRENLLRRKRQQRARERRPDSQDD